MVGPKEESQLELMKSILWEEYIAFKKELIERKEKEGKRKATETNQEADNLSKQEKGRFIQIKEKNKGR